MTMPGGGAFELGQGQVTGVIELEMCLIRGLLEGEGKLNMDAVSRFYGKWVRSNPFKFGITMSRALRSLEEEGKDTADVCIAAAASLNGSSQSNGSHGRLPSLAVWAHRLNSSQAARAAKIDTSMIHPDPTVQHASACYVLAISHLINHPGDSTGAFQAVLDYANIEGNDDIREWVSFVTSEEVMPGYSQTGYAKVGFTHSFKHLLKGTRYTEGLKEALALGGDTSFNPTIVGALLGALHGVENLPGEYVEKVTEYCYGKKGGIKRPEDFLNQTELLWQLNELFTMAPATANVVIGGVEEAL